MEALQCIHHVVFVPAGRILHALFHLNHTVLDCVEIYAKKFGAFPFLSLYDSKFLNAFTWNVEFIRNHEIALHHHIIPNQHADTFCSGFLIVPVVVFHCNCSPYLPYKR